MNADSFAVEWQMPYQGTDVGVFATMPDGAWPNLVIRAHEIELGVRVVRSPEGEIWAEQFSPFGYLTGTEWVPLRDGQFAEQDDFAAALIAFVGEVDGEYLDHVCRIALRGLIAASEDFITWVARDQRIDTFHDHVRNQDELRYLMRQLRRRRNRLAALKVTEPIDREIAQSLATDFIGGPHELIHTAKAIAKDHTITPREPRTSSAHAGTE